ncbi:putative nudix hydrolase 7 [Echria macrotheca]|uniref:Nudix hydrolase 7 n=1 Tax=Echria macrotheca TaxID=438768 RepID=A0AAJ0F2T0_9PEZI|nr:putative nudix hydrolase 7 [Echria macrotheca]
MSTSPRRQSSSSPSLPPTQSPKGQQKKRTPVSVRPSASIVLVSPQNQVLLLHRVQTSSSFASAHVFPGGNLSGFHDGELVGGDVHVDSEAYRLAAVRETFEESGILLVKRRVDGGGEGEGGLVRVDEEAVERGRREVHANKVRFGEWVGSVGGVIDVDGLIPFTRWITPMGMPKRFSTQMYLYLLPLSTSTASEVVVHTPTHDGGVEHTAAKFDDAGEWLEKAQRGEIVLFPPQYYLLTLVAQFLSGAPAQSTDTHSREHYQAQRDALLQFLRTVPTTRTDSPSTGKQHPTANIPWAEKVMSPTSLFMRKDGRVVLGLDKPGPELKGSGRGGDWDRVVLVKFYKSGPSGVEVRWREDVLKEERDAKL